MKTTLQTTIQNGLEYLEKTQQKNGSFLTYLSDTPTFESIQNTFTTTFTNSLILRSLYALPQSDNRDTIAKKLIHFLLQEKTTAWTFNYWSKKTPEYTKIPYPDDADDTFCAASALTLWKPTLFTGKTLGLLVQTLTQLEKSVGGPYRTWIVPTTIKNPLWLDVDPAVNANIGYFLSLHDIYLPKLSRYLQKAVIHNSLESPYYASVFPVLYFLSFWHPQTPPPPKADTVLNHSLALKILLNRNKKITNECVNLVKTVVSSQHTDGSYSLNPFYMDTNMDHTALFFAGSPALSTALALEASGTYLQISKNTHKENQSVQKTHDHTNETVTAVSSYIQSISPEGYKETLPIITSLTQGNLADQICLLPYMFWEELSQKHKNLLSTPENFLASLSQAALYGWIAYTIYDNIIDNEENNTITVSVANICLRRLTVLFHTVIVKHTDIPNKETYQRAFDLIVDTILNTIDAANIWEVRYCHVDPKTPLHTIRPPAFKEFLSEMNIPPIQNIYLSPSKKRQQVYPVSARSFGHVLSILAIVYAIGKNINDSDVLHLLQGFHHYLTARQLNDDAHDWKNDLLQGRINSTAAFLIQKYKNKKKKIRLETLEKLFWTDAIPFISKRIIHICEDGIKSFKMRNTISKSSFMISALQEQQSIALQAFENRQNILDFIHQTTE